MNTGSKHILAWFLRSQYLRTIVTATVSAGVGAVVAKGWIPDELQTQSITAFTGVATLVVNLLAENMLKEGGKVVQAELNTTLNSQSQIREDGVMLPHGETVQATRTVVRNTPNDLHVGKRG